MRMSLNMDDIKDSTITMGNFFFFSYAEISLVLCNIQITVKYSSILHLNEVYHSHTMNLQRGIGFNKIIKSSKDTSSPKG